MIEWNIQSRAHACQACARPFVPKQVYHTLLFEEQPGYARFDICQACWTAQSGQGASARPGFVSRWQGVFEVPEVPPDPIQKATAETLLRQLVEVNDPKYGAACYILAVMLERKRLLKVREQTQRDGRRIFLYEHAQTGDLFTITDPALRLDQLEEVQRDLAQLLEHGLNPPTPAAPPAAEPAGGTPTAASAEPGVTQSNPPPTAG